jgi:hypothetical protein
MTLRAATGAVSSDARIAEAAASTLQRGGTAIDACISAWFVAAAIFPGVLLGPLHMLVAGPGVGAHAYDGSVLQPGKDAPRPRGFREGDEIPDAAHVAVCSAVHALTAAHAQDGSSSLVELSSAGSRAAQSDGAKARARVLRRIAEVGVIATREPAFVRPLLELAGRANGGNLTTSDIESASATITRSDTTSGIFRLSRAVAVPSVRLQPVVACACDVRGVLAAMHCGFDPDGLQVPDLELAAPRLAQPVRRGIPRVSPGVPLPLEAPIAIALESSVPWAAAAAETSQAASFDSLAQRDDPSLTIERRLRAVIDCSAAQAAIALVRAPGAAGGVRIVRVLA